MEPGKSKRRRHAAPRQVGFEDSIVDAWLARTRWREPRHAVNLRPFDEVVRGDR